MSRALAAIGGVVGAVALIVLLALLIWFCVFHNRSASRSSETGSSDPSFQGRHAGIELSLRDARRFEMEELSMATKNFNEVNLIGEGKFGEVYKGLLHDGVLVAIKKRYGLPSQEFIDEVRFLSSIQHRNLVSLLGYCQENNLQFLVYEYVPNGSVSCHLFGSSQVSSEKLEFKHRLSIAIGAAKGLAHIHSLSPRLVHKDFKTANVLVDENFIPKVADSGLPNILGKGSLSLAGSSSSQEPAHEIFLSPEVREFGRFSEKSDTYSFGVFLLELLSGREATMLSSPVTNQNVIELLQNNEDYSKLPKIIDQRMGNLFTVEGMEEYIQLIIQCIDLSSERRPGMNNVVVELDRILEKEMNLTSVMGGEGMPNVTLGSQLFKAMK